MENKDAGRDPRATDHQEVEWQFDALDIRPVLRWLEGRASENGEPLITPSGEGDISDTYLDTGDWRIHRAGYALRLRNKGGKYEATMKLLAPAEGEGLRRRREISEPLDSKDISKSNGPVGERIRALTGPKSLKPLFEVRTRRRTSEVSFGGDGENGEAKTVGEIALDETEIPVEDGPAAVLRRVEVELERGSPESLEPFVEELRLGCRLSPATVSKFEAGLLAGELSPPEAPEFGSKEISSSLKIGEVAYAVMREQFEIFLRYEPATRVGEDSEDLHDMRVASRRLRAAMQVFKEALPVRSKRFRDELKWIAGVLGEVRDLDVQLEQLDEWVSEADPEDREPLGELRGVLEERREKARKAMLRALDSRRYARFVESYSAFLRRGPSRRSANARRRVLEAAPEIIARRYQKFRKVGDVIEDDSPAEEYHELRKRGKRLRYTLEFFSKVYGKSVTERIKALKSLQDVLGDHQDAVVATAQLRELALPAKRRRGGSVSPQAVFVMGGISRRYQTLAAELRKEFPDAYAKVKGKRWKKFEKVMDRTRPESA
ncbi:MAG: CHAD domain-containing protein [Rubrobacteraceae bacterium]